MIPKNHYPVVILILVVAWVICGCAADTPAVQLSPTSTPLEILSTETPGLVASIAQTLPNLEYPIELASTGKAQLEDGVFEESAAPDSATKTKFWLGDVQALGDVNGDGAEDALVILVVDPGGSGTFTYLTLVVNEEGTAKPLAAVLLGDRVVVKSLALESGNVVVSLLTRKPDEPMSAEPMVEVTRLFKLLGDRLVEETG